MALEIEIKLKLDHLAPLRDRLRKLGATHIGEVMETNVFFDTTDRALLGSDCGLRLRCARDRHSGAEKRIITYKGPRGEGPIKTREEIEIHVDDAQASIQLLHHIGYRRVLAFEKRRESWTFEGCSVELDQLPQLGSFVEIECQTESEVLRIRQKLGLADVPAVTQTYADLVSHHLSDRGNRETMLSFAV